MFIKKFIDYIKQINNKTKNKTDANILSEYNYITFYIDNISKDCKIKAQFTNIDDASCEKFATMLYNINSGLYKGSIFDLIADMGKNNIDIDAFTKNIIIYWSYLLREEKSIKKDKDWTHQQPLILPTEFHRYAK